MLIAVWNILFILEFGRILVWDTDNIQKILSGELEWYLGGFAFTAVFGGFLLTHLVQKNAALEKWIFKEGSSASDNADMLNVLSFALGFMSVCLVLYVVLI